MIGTGNCAERTADGDEAVEPLALLDREEVGHEGPEDGGVKEIEHTDPDIEPATDPDLLFAAANVRMSTKKSPRLKMKNP